MRVFASQEVLQIRLTKLAPPYADRTSITEDGTQLLRFVNQVRGVQDLEPLRYLNLRATDSGDERQCVLAQALNCRVGGAMHPIWAAAGRWAMRFKDLWTTRTVGIVTEQEWLPGPFEVRLPDQLVDFAVAAHHDLIEADELGFVYAWLVPRDGDDLSLGFVRLVMPGFEETLAIAA